MTRSKLTIVIFRKYRTDGSILALFPELHATVDGRLITSYQHVGQHGAADYAHCIRITTPATPAEYAALRRELEGNPYRYRFDVRTRYTRRRSR